MKPNANPFDTYDIICDMEDGYIFEGKGVKIKRNHVILPDGTSFERDFVETGNKVIVIPIIEKDKFLLLRFYSPITETETLRFPRGTIDENETVEHAAKRELLEETAYVAKKIKELPGSFYPNPAWNVEYWKICVAEALEKRKVERDKYESQDLVTSSAEELQEKITKGEVFDTSTVVSFYLYKLHQ